MGEYSYYPGELDLDYDTALMRVGRLLNISSLSTDAIIAFDQISEFDDADAIETMVSSLTHYSLSIEQFSDIPKPDELLRSLASVGAVAIGLLNFIAELRATDINGALQILADSYVADQETTLVDIVKGIGLVITIVGLAVIAVGTAGTGLPAGFYTFASYVSWAGIGISGATIAAKLHNGDYEDNWDEFWWDTAALAISFGIKTKIDGSTIGNRITNETITGYLQTDEGAWVLRKLAQEAAKNGVGVAPFYTGTFEKLKEELISKGISEAEADAAIAEVVGNLNNTIDPTKYFEAPAGRSSTVNDPLPFDLNRNHGNYHFDYEDVLNEVQTRGDYRAWMQSWQRSYFSVNTEHTYADFYNNVRVDPNIWPPDTPQVFKDLTIAYAVSQGYHG